MKKKRKKQPHISRGERLCRSLLTLTMTLGALWGAWQLIAPKPAIADNTPPVRLDGADAEQTAAPADDAYKRKPDCWTFLLVGMDKGGGNTDTLMLVTYDAAARTVSVGSIARDTRVDVERKLKKINAAYAYGKMEGLLEEVGKTFGVPIDYYLRVNINGFVRLVDAVGGVDFDVPCNMDYDDPYQDLSIHYAKGTRHLSGQQALEVCRFRQNNDGSGYGDGGRQQTQRGVLTAVVKKALANPGKLNEYVQIAADNLDTNLSFGNLVWFATKALSLDTENVRMMSMPCEWHSPYMYLDPDATLEMVNEYFNPYVLPRAAEQLDVITRGE